MAFPGVVRLELFVRAVGSPTFFAVLRNGRYLFIRPVTVAVRSTGLAVSADRKALVTRA